MTTFEPASDRSLMVYLVEPDRRIADRHVEADHRVADRHAGCGQPVCADPGNTPRIAPHDEVNLATHHRVLKLLRLLESQPIAGVLNLHPAYNSILIVFDPLTQDHASLERQLAPHLARLDSIPLPEPRTVEVLVQYGGDSGPDLAELAVMHDLSAERVIELHSRATYIVYFVGFVPGFAYLGGLPEGLATPRLERPRKRVPKGSVAIGGSHTGVYPFETPGGWRIIGRTPLEIFDPDSAELSKFRMGDRVRFIPIR